MKIHFSSLSRKGKLLALSALPVLLAATYFLGGSYSIYYPVPFNEPTLSQAVQWVQTHEDSACFGVVTLPQQFAALSTTGKAYVSHADQVLKLALLEKS